MGWNKNTPFVLFSSVSFFLRLNLFGSCSWRNAIALHITWAGRTGWLNAEFGCSVFFFSILIWFLLISWLCAGVLYIYLDPDSCLIWCSCFTFLRFNSIETFCLLFSSAFSVRVKTVFDFIDGMSWAEHAIHRFHMAILIRCSSRSILPFLRIGHSTCACSHDSFGSGHRKRSSPRPTSMHSPT